MSVLQQYPPSRYYTLGGQSAASGRPGTMQRRMMMQVGNHHNNSSSTMTRRRESTAGAGGSDEATPICRCRVLYLGSAVPQVTKDGLQGIQEPLRELYPEGGAMGAKGIDSWLSVWSNGLLLENVDENHQRVTRFFPIESLHYCAAVRYVLVPSASPPPPASSTGPIAGDADRIARFLPLDSPFARHPNIHHPPLFACIMRRTTGIKVLECHVFICKRETAANALVRCCFHAYADSTYARHLEEEEEGAATKTKRSATLGRPPGTNGTAGAGPNNTSAGSPDMALNSIEKVETWKLYQQQQQQQQNGRSKSAEDVAAAIEKEGSTSSHGMGSASVSMLVLDHGSADEDNASSIGLNGAADTNHKVWLPPAQTDKTSKSRLSSAGRSRLVPTGPVASIPRGGPVPVADMYGTSTLRSIRSTVSSVMPTSNRRPRQIPAPSSAPPPPPPVIFLPGIDESDSKVAGSKSGGSKRQHNTSGGSGSHNNNNNNNKRGSDLDDMSSVMTGPSTAQPGRRPSNSVFNFPLHHPNGRMPAMMGYPPQFFPPHGGRGGAVQPPGPPPPPPGAILVPMPVPTSNGKKSKFGTFGSSARGGGGKFKLPKSSSKALKQQALLAQQQAAAMAAGIPPPGAGGQMMFIPPPPPVMAPPMALGVPVPMMAPPLSMRRGGQMGLTSMEEPIYMPSHVRPLSPIASYAPAHFPHEAYLMQQQYAAAAAASGGGGPYPGPMGFVPMPPPPGSMAGTLTKPGKKDKKLSKKEKEQLQLFHQQQMLQHHHHHQQQLAIMDGMSIQAEEDEEEVSISSQTGNGTGGGIYRKGHLNERAFSYSIRQEHRSRSYSSLAGLGGHPSPYMMGGGLGPADDLRTHDKKERELIQMVHDLDLSGDDLERSQVPLAMYPGHNMHRQPR